MGAGAAGVHDALGDALVIEMGDLLAEDEILEQGRPALSALQRILVVGDRRALIGRKHAVEGGDGLVGFAAFSGAQRRGFRVGGRSPGRRLGHGRNSDARKNEGRRRHEARTTT